MLLPLEPYCPNGRWGKPFSGLPAPDIQVLPISTFRDCLALGLILEPEAAVSRVFLEFMLVSSLIEVADQHAEPQSTSCWNPFPRLEWHRKRTLEDEKYYCFQLFVIDARSSCQSSSPPRLRKCTLQDGTASGWILV